MARIVCWGLVCLQGILLLILAARFSPALVDRLVQPRPPSVLLVTIDMLETRHLHCYTGGKTWTPSFHSLASDGILFERMYAQAPVTDVSHASLMTSRYPSELFTDRDPRVAVHTMAEQFARRGFRTAYFPSCGLLNPEVTSKEVADVLPFGRGFQETFPVDAREGVPLFDTHRSGTDTNRIAISWIARQSAAGRPWFAHVHYRDLHPPAVLSFQPVDDNLGALLAAVDRENAVVAVLSDHASSPRAPRLLDRRLHVPFLMQVPGGPRGARVKRFAQAVDVGPTLLAAACGEYSRDACSGRDLFGDAPRREVVAESRYLDGRMLRGERFKYVEYFTDRPERYLFDMQADPEEKRNVIARHAAEAQRMQARLAGYLGPAGAHQIMPDTKRLLQRLDYF